MTDTIFAWSQTASDNASADTTVNWAEFQTPSSVNDSARAMMKRIADYISDQTPANRTSTGSANAYAVTSDAAGATFRNGEAIAFIPHVANTTACTLNVDNRGAKPWGPAPGVAFSEGNILAGVPVIAYYRALTDEWISPGTGYYVTSAASGVALQSITARLPQIGDLVVSYAPTPGAGRIRLTEATQSVLKSSYPELNSYLSSISYPWGSTATHFSLPPAAGYFLRIAGTSATVDTGGARTAGSTQADQNKQATIAATGLTATTTISPNPHSHTYSAALGSFGIGSDGGGATSATATQSLTTGTASLTAATTLGGSVTLAGGTEVRVKNVAFHLDVVASTALAAAQVAVFGYPFQWDTGTSDASPGSGRVRVNNADASLATIIYISESDGWGANIGPLLTSISDADILTFSKVGAQLNRLVFRVSGTVTAATGYYKIPVAVSLATGEFDGGTAASGNQLAFEHAVGGHDGVTIPDISGLPVMPYSDITPSVKSIVYDPVTSSHKAVYLQRGYIDPCNPEFGAAGDGVTDDTAALQAALDYAATVVGDYENLPTFDEFNEGFGVVVDGGGRNYLISSTLGMLTASYRGIIFQNMKLTADSGASWSSTVPMFKTDLGARVHMRDVYFECNRVASAIWKKGWGAQNWFERIVVRHFDDYGLMIDEGSDTRGDFLDIMKWSSADPEHYIAAERTGTGIWLKTDDCKFHAALVRNCGIPIRIGDHDNGITAFTSVWTQCHAWNGVDSGTPIRDLIQIQVDSGSINHTFVGSYLGNGHIDLYDHWVRFLACKWMDTTQAPERARIRVFAKSVGATAPNELIVECESVPVSTYGGISVAATTVSGSDIVTMSASNVAKCAPLNGISGTGIPTGCTIIDVPSSTTVRISANAAASGTITATVRTPLIEFVDDGANTWVAGINNDKTRYPHSIRARVRADTVAMLHATAADAITQFYRPGSVAARISMSNGDTTTPPSISAVGNEMHFGRSTTDDWIVDASGRMLLGPTTAVVGTFNSASLTPRLQVAGTSTIDDNAIGMSRFVANSGGPVWQFAKSRGATIGSHGAALSFGDALGSISAIGSDGTNWNESVKIDFQADTAASSGIVPGRIRLHTADSSGVLRERIRLDSSGNVGIGATADRRLHSEVDDATTNAATYALRLTHTTTGTPAIGIGVGMEFEVETSSNNNEVGARISAVTTAVTATAENFDIVLEAMAAGSTTLVEVGRFTSDKKLKLPAASVIDLGAGAATVTESSGKLTVAGSGNVERFEINSGTATTVARVKSSGAAAYLAFQNTGGTASSVVMGVASGGDFELQAAAAKGLQVNQAGGTQTFVNALEYRVANTKVVGARDTGWTAMTGTGSKGALAAAAAGTASAAYVQAELQGALNRIAALEARLRSLDAALITHGLIGP